MKAKKLNAELLQEIVGIQLIQSMKNLELRNHACQKLFATRANRKVRIQKLIVETWWDKRSRNWITEVKYGDDELTTDHDAVYTGNPDDAAVAHFWKLWQIVALVMGLEGGEET